MHDVLAVDETLSAAAQLCPADVKPYAPKFDPAVVAVQEQSKQEKEAARRKSERVKQSSHKSAEASASNRRNAEQHGKQTLKDLQATRAKATAK